MKVEYKPYSRPVSLKINLQMQIMNVAKIVEKLLTLKAITLYVRSHLDNFGSSIFCYKTFNNILID